MLIRIFARVLFGLSIAVVATAAERPLVLDPAQSRVEIAVKVTVDSFVAKLNQFDAAVTMGDDGRATAARFAFRFSDIATGKKARDDAMHKWQQTDTHPDGVFSLTSLEAAEGNKLTAFGRLTLHGVTREIRFPVSMMHEGERHAIDGDAPVDVREFGLPIIRMFGVLKVDPVVHVRFHLQGAMELRPGVAR